LIADKFNNSRTQSHHVVLLTRRHSGCGGMICGW